MSLTADGERWRYELVRGGSVELALSEDERRSLHLDARLQRRLRTITEDELKVLEARLRGDLEFGEVVPEQVLKWMAGGGQRLLSRGGEAAGEWIGVSAIGEYVCLPVTGEGAGGTDLARATLKWGCGRVHASREPLQVMVLPAVAASEDAAGKIVERLRGAGLRTTMRVDGTLGRRLRDCWFRQVPLMVVVAPTEVGGGMVELRRRGSRDGALVAVEALAERLSDAVDESDYHT